MVDLFCLHIFEFLLIISINRIIELETNDEYLVYTYLTVIANILVIYTIVNYELY